MVYVLNQNGEPLMPMKRFGKVRRMLKNKQAKVVRRRPFTIQLLYTTTNYVQPVTLGVDAGYQTVGFLAVSEKGVQNKGAYVKLEGLAKPVKVEQVTMVKYGKGFHMTAPIHPLPTPIGA